MRMRARARAPAQSKQEHPEACEHWRGCDTTVLPGVVARSIQGHARCITSNRLRPNPRLQLVILLCQAPKPGNNSCPEPFNSTAAAPQALFHPKHRLTLLMKPDDGRKRKIKPNYDERTPDPSAAARLLEPGALAKAMKKKHQICNLLASSPKPLISAMTWSAHCQADLLPSGLSRPQRLPKPDRTYRVESGSRRGRSKAHHRRLCSAAPTLHGAILPQKVCAGLFKSKSSFKCGMFPLC